MKKLLILAISIFSVMSCFSGCDILTNLFQNNSSCEHTYEWVTSENGHQKVYSCGCPMPDIMEIHIDTNEDCVCDIRQWIIKVVK